MKSSGKIIKEALEYMTQYMLLPGVELNIDNVMLFYKSNLGKIGTGFKIPGIKSAANKH